MVYSDQTLVQTVYFTITVGLYMSSTAYHYLRPNALLRFIDQTMISWYILVAPLPFVYHEPWAIPLFVILAVLSVINKWFGFERDDDVGSWIFLGQGVLSAGVMFTFGFENMGVAIWSSVGLAVVVAIICFVGKWAIYHFQMNITRRFPNVWEPTEMGHCVLSWGVTIITLLVITYPI